MFRDMKGATYVIAAGLAVAGCSTASKDIAGAYVSPLQYQGYDCDQVAAESQRVYQRVNQLGGRLDQAAQNDKALVGVGAILFWPALFALGGTKEQEAEYARLKGEHDALQQTAVAKKCPGAVGSGTATAAAGAASAVPASPVPGPVPAAAVPPQAPASTAI